MTVTIWHNPKCGTSRDTLAMIRGTGVEPVVVEYLKNVPSLRELAEVAAAVGGATALLRLKEAKVAELGLADADDATILAAMSQQPIVIERPVVFGPRGIVVARPAERVLAVLDEPLP